MFQSALSWFEHCDEVRRLVERVKMFFLRRVATPQKTNTLIKDIQYVKKACFNQSY